MVLITHYKVRLVKSNHVQLIVRMNEAFLAYFIVPFYEDSYLRSVEFFPIVNRLLRLLCQFLLHLRTSSKKDVVDKSIFQKSQEDKDKAAHQVHVYSFDVGDLGQSLSQVCVDGCHGQDSGDAWEVNNKSELQSACRPLQTFRTVGKTAEGHPVSYVHHLQMRTPAERPPTGGVCLFLWTRSYVIKTQM